MAAIWKNSDVRVLSASRESLAEFVRITPGEFLAEEFLDPLGLSANALAMALRVPATRIQAIVNGKRAITADTALRLGRYFGTTAEFWANLQSIYELDKAKREKLSEIMGKSSSARRHREVQFRSNSVSDTELRRIAFEANSIWSLIRGKA